MEVEIREAVLYVVQTLQKCITFGGFDPHPSIKKEFKQHRLSSVLFGLSKNVVEPVLDPPKMYCLWLIRHIPIYIFKESEQLRMSFVYDNGVCASLCVDCSNRYLLPSIC